MTGASRDRYSRTGQALLQLLLELLLARPAAVAAALVSAPPSRASSQTGETSDRHRTGRSVALARRLRHQLASSRRPHRIPDSTARPVAPSADRGSPETTGPSACSRQPRATPRRGRAGSDSGDRWHTPAADYAPPRAGSR